MLVYTVVVAVLLPAGLLLLLSGYVLQDLRYFLKGVWVALRLRRFRSSSPAYSVLDCFLERVQKSPDKAFLLFEGRSYSYREVDRRSSQAARALLEHARVRQGDTVALFVGNEPEFVWVWLGLFKLGCTVALLNTNIRSGSLLHCFSCCRAKVLIAGSDLQEAVKEVLPVLKEQQVQVFMLEENSRMEGVTSLREKINKASEENIPISHRSTITMKSPALYIYTSGTTGLPKAALITHERVWLASFLQSICGVCSDDIIYIYLPLYHSSGLLMGLTGAIERGVTVVLRRKFSASQFWSDCRKHNVTVIQYIGEIIRYLCNTPTTQLDREHKVRLALGNGLRPDTWAEFVQRFGGVKICECYGATEGNVGFVNYVGKIGALGRVNPFIKKTTHFALIKYDSEKEEPVRDSRGFCVEVPTGETGLLVAKISKMASFSGYANNQQQTEKKKLKNVFKKGDYYFNTGDLMRIDQQGFVYFQDRIGDTFRWKGENVATTEVSDVLLTVEFIEEACVYGVRVPGHEGRIGMAAVKLKDGERFDSSVIHKTIVNLLPTYARPRFIRIQDALAVTSTYKQMKVKLAEEGFDPKTTGNSLYFLDERKQCYVPMSEEIFNSISEGQIRL